MDAGPQIAFIAMHTTLHAGEFRIPLDRPLIMGIVNITPDSFSDGGDHLLAPNAIAHARRLIEEGADILDIGGESSRPGAQPVAAEEELRRVLPVIAALRDCGVPLSIDTAKPEVMRAALQSGAVMVNDIEALQAPGAVGAVKEAGAAVCLMHMQGKPRTMQVAPSYGDIVAEISAFLSCRIAAAQAGGIGLEHMVLDPGFGFGKTVEHNLQLLKRLGELLPLGLPLLVGLSRKSTLGAIIGKPVGERLHASVAAALLAIERGASIVRVHDVAPTREALAVLQAMQGSQHSAR